MTALSLETVQVHLMGTVIDVQVEAEAPGPLLTDALRLLRMYEHRFSANDPDSELGEVNRAAGRRSVAVHPELYELLALGVEHSRAPGSMLNVAIGPLVQAWRIGFPDARVLDRGEIEDALELCDPWLIDLDDAGRRVFLGRAGMKIDLGAIAKGYIADRVISFLRSEGARSAYINLGGNVLVHGPAPGRPDSRWRVGLRHPLHPEGSPLGAVQAENQSVVTSGVYQRRLTDAGRVFHHILDPRTGYPVDTDVLSLTVVSTRSVDGEIWTSRLFGRSVQDTLGALATLPDCSGVVITENLELFASGALRDRLVTVSS